MADERRERRWEQAGVDPSDTSSQEYTASWGQTDGPTEYLVIGGRIVALLYWSGPQLGHEGGPEGEPVVTDAGWFWVAVDDPDNHCEVDAPTLREDMSYEELDAAWNAARMAATRDALKWMNRGRS